MRKLLTAIDWRLSKKMSTRARARTRRKVVYRGRTVYTKFSAIVECTNYWDGRKSHYGQPEFFQNCPVECTTSCAIPATVTIFKVLAVRSSNHSVPYNSTRPSRALCATWSGSIRHQESNRQNFGPLSVTGSWMASTSIISNCTQSVERIAGFLKYSGG